MPALSQAIHDWERSERGSCAIIARLEAELPADDHAIDMLYAGFKRRVDGAVEFGRGMITFIDDDPELWPDDPLLWPADLDPWL